MSTPLASEKVKEIRDIFDQQSNPAESSDTKNNKMTSRDRLKEKEMILTRLATAKEKLDTKMDGYYSKRRLDQTMDVPAVSTANTWMQSTDESFLRWEQDCDMTMLPQSQSANNRTLRADKVAAPQDPEMAAIDRLMREYNLDNQDHHQGVDPDQTQLEDVEPPSGIWETTIMGAKMTSPVKMMHAVRPSTIIEETSSSQLMANDSMASSYKTAASRSSKLAPSERYETATETICLSSDQSDKDDVIEILDDSLESRRKQSSSSGAEDNTTASSDTVGVVSATGTLDGISSLMPDESSYGTKSSRDSGDFSLPESKDSLLEDTPDFNDTLERIEFMEKQGRRLMEQQQLQQHHETPKPTTPLLAKSLLPNAASSKRVFYPSPNSSSSTFKKPGNVRSPQVKFVPPKRNFDHIVSPIATYIKDVPSSTLYTKYKGQCLFSKNSPIKPNTPTKEDTKENKQSQLKPPQWNIPRKVFTSTNNRHEIDTRMQTKIPGGNKVHQMIQPSLGNPHKIIRHEGRVKMDMHPSSQQQHQPRDSIFDETFARDMSVVSGDVSIQVIRDIKKH